MKKIILSFLIISALSIGHIALAENGMLMLIPASGDKVTGTDFDISVQVDNRGNEVCSVKGALSFDNLVCKNIDVLDGATAQIAPTCASPNFVLEIPECSTNIKEILKVSVEGDKTGLAVISFADVSVSDLNNTVAFSTAVGTYNMISNNLLIATQQTTPENIEATQETESDGFALKSELEVEKNDMLISDDGLLNQPAFLGKVGLATLFSDWLGWIVLAVVMSALITWWIYSAKREEVTPQ